jgi:predicted MFS family arabinose efflux permease
MLIPVRLLLAFKPSVAPALLVAIASSTVVFSATPFLLPAIAADRDISLSLVGWISTGQLGGFVVASFLAGRLLRPERHVFIIGAVLGVLANLSSAVAPNLALLTVARSLSGLSLGLAAWFGWQAAFGDNDRTGDVAVIGPLVGVVSAPAVSLLIQTAGVDWLFVVLAAVTGLPLLFAHRIERSVAPVDRGERHGATRAARLILLALGLITMGGSTVFVYAAAIGTGLNGLSAGTVALLFSGNAMAGIPSAKWQGRRGSAGFWFFGTAVCSVLIASVRNDFVFAIGLVGWGFIFFMGLPAAFGLLAARSAYPQERAGDAQAIMALGRVFGPLIGGALLASGSSTSLGIVAAGIIATAALMLLYADRRNLAFRRSSAPSPALVTP